MVSSRWVPLIAVCRWESRCDYARLAPPGQAARCWRSGHCRGLSPEATNQAIAPLLGLAPSLGMDSAVMQLHLSAYQWIVRADNPG